MTLDREKYQRVLARLKRLEGTARGMRRQLEEAAASDPELAQGILETKLDEAGLVLASQLKQHVVDHTGDFPQSAEPVPE